MLARFAALAVVVVGCGYTAPAVPDAETTALPSVAFEDQDGMSGADELSGTVSIAVTLSAPAESQVTVNYQVTGGTATPGSDFTVSGLSLSFGVGEMQKTVDVTITNDSDMTESSETIILELSSPVGATIGAPSEHTITIADHILPRVQFVQVATSTNEAAQTMVAVSLDKPAEGVTTVVLGIGAGGTATVVEDFTVTDGTVFTFADGTQTAMLPIGEVDDQLDEADQETLLLALKNPSGNVLIGSLAQTTHSIGDNDALPTVEFTVGTSQIAEDGTQATVEVRLVPVSGRTVTINFDRANTGTATVPDDATVVGAPGTITFGKGEVSKLITVTIVNDTLDEVNETIDLTLSTPVNAQLARAAHTLTINDNDPPPNISFMGAASTVTEGAALTLTVPVVLSTASGRTITAPFSVGASTASNPGDFTITASPLTFLPGSTMQVITLTIVNDDINEPAEIVTLNLGNANDATEVAPLTHVVTINDDADTQSVVQFDPAQTDGNATEGDAPPATQDFLYDVVLDKASGFTVDVEIDITGDADAADFTALGVPVSFAPGETRKAVTLRVIRDNNNDGGPTDTITMTIDPVNTTNATVGNTDERQHVIVDDD